MAKRRINHEGSLTLRKDGLWVGRVSHEGKRIAAYGRTKEQARQKLRELIKKQEQGQSLVTTSMPLREYLAQMGVLYNAGRPALFQHRLPCLADVVWRQLSQLDVPQVRDNVNSNHDLIAFIGTGPYTVLVVGQPLR